MTAILPISTVRVSDSLLRSRLTQQVQSDQLDLFRIQNQLSTGRRIFNPSDDAPSALRAITLQRNLERKDQVQLNLASARDVLSAAGSALGETSAVLTDIRGAALSVSGTDATQLQRDAVIKQVDEAIDALLRFGNSTFRDNFLFGGTQGTSSPYVSAGGYIEYRGNEQILQSFVDTNVLFDVNLSGQEAFGGISEAVRGSTDLSPQLTSDTLLSQLNGGLGVARDGAIQIDFVPDSPGGVVTESTTIDLRAASTVGDVARLIEAGAPPSADVRVSLTGGSLSITTNGATSGGVVISEVGQGRTAENLGILTSTSSNAITGGDLDPVLRSTTQLDTLLGTRSQARLISGGANNDLIITATQNGLNASNGDPLDGVVVQIVDGGVGTTANATYDGGGSTLTIEIDAAAPPTAQEVADLINNESSGYFNAQIDLADASSALQAGQGSVAVTSQTTTGGSGTTLDLASGLLIENGDGPTAIDTSGVETVFDLLETLNRPELGLTAQLNATGTGIDVRTRRSGADFTIGENGGQLAAQLGLRTYTLDSKLEDFNRGLGVAISPEGDFADASAFSAAFAANNVFEIEVTDGNDTDTYRVDLTDVVTVEDLVNRISTDTNGAVIASLSTTGNGLVLEGTNPLSASDDPATGTFDLNTDTLTITADTPGYAGNQDFVINIEDDLASGRSVSVSGNVITVQLGGTTVNTTTLAGEISTELPGFTVTGGGSNTVTAVANQSFSTTGGQNISTAGADNITVRGSAAQRLGFFGPEADSASGATLTAEDRHTFETDSAFNTLIRLREALAAGDVPGIGAAIERLDEDLNRVVFAESEAGARVQTLDVLQTRLEDEEVQLRSALSDEIDVDLTEAISEFTARQFALQASLQTSANLLQLSLLNFI